jgi:23S rRNA (uracil1939-C5)-methyltransferase
VEALARAGFPDAPVGEIAVTPSASRRRADLALRRRAADGGVALGFHARGGEADAVLDLATCAVLDPRLVALFDPLRALLKRLPALRREGSAVLNLLDTGPDLLLRTDGGPLDAQARAMLAAFAAEHGVPRIAWARGGDAPETAAQLSPVALRLGDARVVPPPGAFLQATPQGEAAIRAAVLAGLPERLPPRAVVAELYAGLGTLSFALATRARVAAFEGAVEAVAALSAAAGKAGARVTATRRDLARQPLPAKELAGFAAVVLDPPYVGAAEQVPLIARARVPRVVYVSCNPAALARDAAQLARAGYRVLAATPVDQFLWSPHLESVVAFARPAASRRTDRSTGA